MAKIGYIRVSSIGQETARQDQLMRELGVEKVFSEKNPDLHTAPKRNAI